jgi:hypothetical protein
MCVTLILFIYLFLIFINIIIIKQQVDTDNILRKMIYLNIITYIGIKYQHKLDLEIHI